MNLFAWGVVTLQLLAAAQYAYKAQFDFAGLWGLYGVANIITIHLASKG